MTTRDEALKLALALALKGKAYAEECSHMATQADIDEYDAVATAIKDALVQPEQRKPLTWQRLQELWIATPSEDAWIDRVWEFARNVEADHGIKEGA